MFNYFGKLVEQILNNGYGIKIFGIGFIKNYPNLFLALLRGLRCNK